jgi:type I restriction enzyme M protein
MFEQAFKKIDDILRKDAGVSSELDYIEQTSWILFLKYLDAWESDRAQIAELHGKPHEYLLDKRFRWHSWATPLTSKGTVDHNRALIGDDLRDFVDQKLFPYLRGFKQRAERPDTRLVLAHAPISRLRIRNFSSPQQSYSFHFLLRIEPIRLQGRA